MNASPPLFLDRQDAGRRLAAVLRRYAGGHPLVLGIPRGGMAVAAVVARAVGGELDALIVRKVGLPWQPELALGAVTADNTQVLNDAIVAQSRLSPAAVRALVAGAAREARQRELELRGGRPEPAMAHHTVLVVDDGLATGATMIAALRSVRAHKPRRLVMAVPAGAVDSLRAVARECDEVVCVWAPEDFESVGACYRVFPQVSDDEVRALLAGARVHHPVC